MEILDIIVLIVLGLSGAMAFSRGFGKEALSLGGWILSAWLTFNILYPAALPIAMKYVPVEIIAQFLAAVVPFLISLILLALISSWLRAYFQAQFAQAGLGTLNRSLGFLFGIFRGGIILSLLYLLMAWILPRIEDRPAFINNARTLPLIEKGALAIQELLPPQFTVIGKAAIDDAQEAVKKGKAVNDLLQIVPAPNNSVTAPITNTPASGQSAPGSAPTDTKAASPDQNGYKEKERKDLERLIQGSEGQGSGTGQ